MSFNHYNVVKDKICIWYAGHSPEYLVQLRYLRKFFEANFPGIKIFYACRSEYLVWLEEDSLSIPLQNGIINKNDFGYNIEILFDTSGTIHPIWNLASSLSFTKLPLGKSQNHFAYVCPEGNFPTKSLTAEETNNLKATMIRRGFKPIVVGTSQHNTSLPVDERPSHATKKQMAQTAGFVVGVECDMLFEAAACGIPTILIPTGLGTDMYNSLYTIAK